jgi:hypothetical protein
MVARYGVVPGKPVREETVKDVADDDTEPARVAVGALSM